MGDKVSFTIELEQSTVQQIDEYLSYYKIRKELTGKKFTTSYEEFIKAAIFRYIERLNKYRSFVINQETYKLKSSSTLKNNLKEYLAEEGIKQKELAELSGVDTASISSILSNRNQPSMDNFLRIWIALGCPPIEELFYRDTE